MNRGNRNKSSKSVSEIVVDRRRTCFTKISYDRILRSVALCQDLLRSTTLHHVHYAPLRSLTILGLYLVWPTVILDDGKETTDYVFSDDENTVQIIKVKRIDEGSTDGDTISQGSTDSSPGSSGGDERVQWGGRLEFLLTCIGYAVGLGNVWRFPYLCYKNGGGAFLVPYTIMLALVGLPLFFMELALGQYGSLGPISVWRINPLFKGLGYAMVIVSWLIGLYYNVIITHVLYYLAMSFTSVLPWVGCDNEWNTEHCITPDYHRKTQVAGNGSWENGTYTTMTNLTNTTGVAAVTGISRTPTEEFYMFRVLGQTSTIDEFGTVEWQLIIPLFVAWLVVFVTLLRGIQSLGKVVYFTAIFPYVMLTVLFFRGVTLPGAGQGILFYITPSFEKLLHPRVWSDAATQIFYSLSACSGGLIAMSSYNKFNNNCYKDALIVCFINCGTSVFAGLVIFSILGFMAYEKGVSMEDVVAGGPGLAFIAYPEAISRMPVSPLWAILFFIMMATLGFGSEFSIVECVLSALADAFPMLIPRKTNIIFRIVACTICFLLGLPMICSGGIYLLNLVDFSVGGFPLLVVGFMELVAINWIYGFDKFSDNIYCMLGRKPNKYWEICWKYVSPLVILITIVLNMAMYEEPKMYGKESYPGWAKSLGWMIVMFPIIVIPIWFLLKYCVDGGYELLKKGMQPLKSWGPSDANKKLAYGDFDVEKDIEISYKNNPREFAKLMSSNLSAMTTVTNLDVPANAASMGSRRSVDSSI
ncbi:hypothetical protein FSP39_000752 [Pinctada imbricata]|uniref:Transporter n=1 Tax=Pinctada imbricata TaxID=66713 RepID=A0AA88Y9L1_PINIB|nr:hypothetical protein FSP39_000752 [Pinctada imbricata]